MRWWYQIHLGGPRHRGLSIAGRHVNPQNRRVRRVAECAGLINRDVRYITSSNLVAPTKFSIIIKMEYIGKSKEPSSAERLVRLYDWVRLEEQDGRTIVCGGILPAKEIRVGQEWVSTSNHVVTIYNVRPIKSHDGNIIDHEIYYSWGKKISIKLSFAFQCRYCLIVQNSNYTEKS